MMSVRLKALDMPTSHTTVRISRAGSGSTTTRTMIPALSSTNTATTWPMTLANGVSTPKSSISPRVAAMVAASSNPSTSTSNSITMPSASRKAMNTASPPRYGTGSRWVLSSPSGASTTPKASAARRATGTPARESSRARASPSSRRISTATP